MPPGAYNQQAHEKEKERCPNHQHHCRLRLIDWRGDNRTAPTKIQHGTIRANNASMKAKTIFEIAATALWFATIVLTAAIVALFDTLFVSKTQK